jgi:hypothetical protein
VSSDPRVEMVARALCGSNGIPPDEPAYFAPPMPFQRKGTHMLLTFPGDAKTYPAWHAWREDALVAIQTLDAAAALFLKDEAA